MRRALVIGSVVLLAVTVAGAAKLIDGPPAVVPMPPQGLAGTTVHGTVDSDPPPVEVGPPAAAGQYPVDQVFVVDGQTVAADARLVQFDDRQLKPKLDQARGKLLGAEALVQKATQGKVMHVAQVATQRKVIQAAEHVVTNAEEAKRRGGELFDQFMATAAKLDPSQMLTDEQKAKRKADNPELFSAEALLQGVKDKLEIERARLAVLEATPVDADIAAAKAEVASAKGLVAEAEAVVENCLVKARTAGTVVQLQAAPGTTFGPTARKPLLLLVPAGKRVVRAEVDPEFAYRVAGKVGAAVTVTDFTNTALTYPGVVREVGSIFLPKRNAGLVLEAPKSLECVIDLPDPTPAGKPPLRVNQPVRVIFP